MRGDSHDLPLGTIDRWTMQSHTVQPIKFTFLCRPILVRIIVLEMQFWLENVCE